MQLAMIQDRIVPFDELESVYLDRGTYFGDGVYEVLRSYNGRIFALSEHLERFARSLIEIDITGIFHQADHAAVFDDNTFGGAGGT